MNKEYFKPSDFIGKISSGYEHAASEIANEKLNKLIESWPILDVERKKDSTGSEQWFAYTKDKIYQKNCTHKARLAFIEPIVKEPCQHEPIHVLKNMCQSQVLTAGKVGFNFFDGWVCRKCNAELTAKWEEKK